MNVSIIHNKGGRAVEVCEADNTWTTYGHAYLAQLISEWGPMGSPAPKRNDRIKYVALGVGGIQQHASSLGSPIVDAYPVGHAELCWPPSFLQVGYTSGNQYNSNAPFAPLVRTLERPVRRSGTQDAYPGSPLDSWFIEPPNIFVTHSSLHSFTVHASLSCSTGDYVYGTFTTMPVCEAALVTAAASPFGAPYSSVVAYVNFSPVILEPDSEVELSWCVSL